MLTRRHLDGALPPGSHGSTFGGNPLASAVARAVLSRIDADGLVENARDTGAYLGERLAGLVRAHPASVAETRGLGLLQALVLQPGVDARSLLEKLRAAGVLLTVAGGTALRFSPALNITRAEVDEGVDVLDRVLDTLERERS
jgi:acetylornithine/N-succinyldiaminopimelate aminotransferase